MSVSAVFLVASTFAYAGFQWTIRLLAYPQFDAVPADAFAGYERSHQQRTSVAVGPLFAVFGAAAVTALVADPGVASIVAAVCFGAILAVTAFAAVPQHRRRGTVCRSVPWARSP